MDSDSVISLSSSPSRPSSPMEAGEELLSISSETQRVPVSWGTCQKTKGALVGFKTPNHAQKVKEWICSYKPQAVCTPPVNEEVSPIEIYDSDEETTNMVCIRYDFDKTEPRLKNLPVKHVLTCNNNNKSIDYENHTKTELCNYLQLVKPSELSNNFTNRRSVRVKNTTEKNERKRKLAKELQNLQSPKAQNNFQELETVVESAFHYPTMKSIQELNMKLEKIERFLNINTKPPNNYLPLPPQSVYKQIIPFENSDIQELVEEARQKTKEIKRKTKKRRFNYDLYPLNGGPKQYSKRVLRSARRLREKPPISARKNNNRRRGKRAPPRDRKAKLERSNKPNGKVDQEIIEQNKTEIRENQVVKEMNNSHTDRNTKNIQIDQVCCETKVTSPDEQKLTNQIRQRWAVVRGRCDDNVNLRNFVDDMLELEFMSAEHRNNIIQSRLLDSTVTKDLISKATNHSGGDVQRAIQIFNEILRDFVNRAPPVSRIVKECETVTADNIPETGVPTELITNEHAYAEPLSDNETDESDLTDENDTDATKDGQTVINDQSQHQSNTITNEEPPVPLNLDVQPVNCQVPVKSLHRSLTLPKRNTSSSTDWRVAVESQKKSESHVIQIDRNNGDIIKASYDDFHLVVAQEHTVTFWTQSALGNILGAQNMWIPKGEGQRLALNSTYVMKESKEMVISCETSVAYVELWIKEHKSDFREVPLADVFVTVYFWRLRQSGVEKKSLQLENIKR